MHLTLTPQMGLPGQPEMTITVAGDVLTIDGTPCDLSAIPEGGEGWPEGDPPFVGPIRRIGGVIHATVRVRLGDTADDDQPDSPWVIPDATGDVAIPAARKPDPEA
jgi:hypothetical protein